MDKFTKFNFSDMNRISINDRKSKVKVEMFPKPLKPGELKSFSEKLPQILKAEDLVNFAEDIRNTKSESRTILAMIGGHVIKCGLAPILADLAERGFITAIAGNGSVIIHDVEIALFGETSEIVDAEIDAGKFGMTKETADFINEAQKEAMKEDKLFAQQLAEKLDNSPNREYSLLWRMHELNLPVTIHPLLGAEVVHPHPSFSPKSFAEVAWHDFRKFTSIVASLKNGIVMNIGSAVVMPEIFLKALTAARNKGNDVSGITAANFDMIQHYRPSTNVLKRPSQDRGKSYSFTGHNEIMIPLLAGII